MSELERLLEAITQSLVSGDGKTETQKGPGLFPMHHYTQARVGESHSFLKLCLGVFSPFWAIVTKYIPS